MKKRIRIFGIITIAVIGLTLIACGPPRLRGTVSIEGIPHIGNTLTANIASLGGSGIITYQWLRDGSTAIGDDNSYTLQLADRDAVITVTVTRSYNSGSVTSTPVTNRGHLGGTGPGGGIIFYHDPNGFIMSDTGERAHYLEAAPVNMTTLAWASRAFIPSNWGGTGNWRSIEGTGTAIGTGRRNTALILAVDANAPAALACRNYSNNGLRDWFLPSRDELSQLYRNRASVGNLGTSWFWSSSQIDGYNLFAWFQYFVDGSQYDFTYKANDGNLPNFGKPSDNSVRAVRAF